MNEGDDFGWPYCYYSVDEHHLVLAPEYGGDGKKVAQCAQKKEPVATFPGHWAPNALFFYTGSTFPGPLQERCIHRVPRFVESRAGAAGGYNVVFQPLNAAGRRPARTRSSPTAFRTSTERARTATIVRPDSRRARTARCTSRTTLAAASIRSCTRGSE